MYTRESLLFKVNEKKFSDYMYEDKFLKKNTIAISMKKKIFLNIWILLKLQIYKQEVFNQFNNSMLKN